jgi:hypothetical protein
VLLVVQVLCVVRRRRCVGHHHHSAIGDARETRYDELVDVLDATAKRRGVSRNALARGALEGIVDPKSLRNQRERRLYERIRAGLAEEEWRRCELA